MRWQNVETPTYAGSAGSNGEPAVVETMTLVDRDGAAVAVFTKDVAGATAMTVDGEAVGVASYLEYTALLTQSSTDAPVATVLTNTLGGTVVWTYDATGSYVATLVSAFTANRTILILGTPGVSGDEFILTWGSADTLSLATLASGEAGDAKLNGTTITVRVYPA